MEILWSLVGALLVIMLYVVIVVCNIDYFVTRFLLSGGRVWYDRYIVIGVLLIIGITAFTITYWILTQR